jgi:hypothetical protein
MLRLQVHKTLQTDLLHFKTMSIQPKFSFTIDGRSLGAILDPTTGYRIGSGFIVDNPNTVMTAYHVSVDCKTNQRRELSYEPPHLPVSPPPKVPVPVKLKPLKNFPELDIAVLTIADGQTPCERNLKRSEIPLKMGEWVAVDFTLFRGNDTIG